MNTENHLLLSRRTVLQNGILVASGCVCARWALGEGAVLVQDSAALSGAQSWTIDNDLVRRVITFEAKAGLFTTQLSCLSTKTDFVTANSRQRAAEFSFRCNKIACLGASEAFNFLNASETPLPNGKSLTIRLRHIEFALEVAVVYRVYDSHPVIRKCLVLRNTGGSPLHLSHLNIEQINIALGPANETTLLTQYGTVPRETFYTGRSEDAALLVSNGRTGDGIAVVSEVPGYMKRTEIAGWDDPDDVRIAALYDTDIMPFERTLTAGEEFTTASVSLAAFRNGDGFNDPHWSLPSYMAQVLMRRVDAQGPPWIYNTWEPFQRKINHDTVLELIDVASTMGIDIFTIDDGWQQEYGDNGVNLSAFPGGLQPIIDVLQARNMTLGLWIPIAALGTSTTTYREHSDWVARDQEGKPKFTGTAAGSKAVMCMASAYRESAADRINDAIERFKLGYVKLDLTTVFNAYGEAPGCWAKGHYHGNWAESLNLIYEGISYVTKHVYEKHPDVLLDLTFELWGQKHIIDAGLLAAGDLDWMSNVDDGNPDSAGPLQAHQLLYSRATSMPAEAMLIGNLHADQASIQERFATAIGSAPLLCGDLRRLSTSDRQWYHERIGWFKRFRRATRISESFFPLGSWQQTTPVAWDGFARIARTGDGVIALFQNKSQATEALVKLPLLPEGRFKLRSVISGRDVGECTRADFLRGMPVRFLESGAVEVLEVTRVIS